MDKISLTASMRSNLLSLQNISGQVDATQNKLSTGKKVNSAIDNPSSYYTALSLNNRADDLNALLDSMGQAVSTIKAATTALESATEFLEQAKAAANQALETDEVPDKSFFEERVGTNGAVVTTAQELRDAVNSGKETICVYGAIDLGDISTSGRLSLKENQKLVGVGYFGNYDTDTNKFSSLSATANTAQNLINITKNGCEVSDLSINYQNKASSGGLHAIFVNGTDVEASIGDIGICVDFASSSESKAAITCFSGAAINLENTIKIQTSGEAGDGIFAYTDAIININSGAKISIRTFGSYGHGIIGHTNATININPGAEISIETSGQSGYGIMSCRDSIVNINFGSQINIETSGQNGQGIYAYNAKAYNIAGNLYIKAEKGRGLVLSTTSGNTVNILSTAQIYFATNSSSEIYNGYNGGDGSNILNIAQGAKLAFEKDGKTNWYEVKEDKELKNDSTTTVQEIAASDVKDKLNVGMTSIWELPEKIEKEDDKETAQDLGNESLQYQEILRQYDALIKDAGYKGINLLQPKNLTVKFNEDNTASLEVQGRDMSLKALGFTVFDWKSHDDINKSIEELTSAINVIRSYSSELGNNYNIITTRQDFTENLINVLTEGADKLTLADMNEESANMLALQTRQQLAINSLSLASQASQSILKLF